jgi:hypothetical protein
MLPPPIRRNRDRRVTGQHNLPTTSHEFPRDSDPYGLLSPGLQCRYIAAGRLTAYRVGPASSKSTPQNSTGSPVALANYNTLIV